MHPSRRNEERHDTNEHTLHRAAIAALASENAVGDLSDIRRALQ
jgi:hypothetical protein